MDIRSQTLNCHRCGRQHHIEIDFSKLSKDQLEGREPVLNFICPDASYMYRVMGFALDTTVNIFKQEGLISQQNIIENRLKAEWGELDFAAKLKRFILIDLSFVGIPDEYYNLLRPVVASYCCGYFYPAMTSAGALGERILNRLIIKLRGHFKSSRHYKKIWNKKSFDHWDTPISILNEWGIISVEVKSAFFRLQKYRNESIHYNDGYDFESNSHDAVKALADIINDQFNYMNRKDLFWVFDMPGEIWLRSAVVNDPFVKEFVLPHCLQLTPYDEPTATPPIKGKNVPLKPLSDEDFIKIRNSRNKK
ncbi:MAG: hypothetical protein ABSA46_10265 [Thermodesulfovibrionales bacterium]|jgi:hypothetical protein